MPHTLSKSSLYVFRECPRCFWLQVNKRLRRPEGIYPSLPSGMDGVLKRHFDTFRERGKLPPELASLKGVKLFADKELLITWTNNRKGVRWTDKDGNTFMGAVDDILVKGKKLIVLDFKTRGYALKEDTAAFSQDQLDMYTLLLQKNGYDTEDYAYLLFFYPESVHASGHFIFHADLVKMQVNVRSAQKLWQDALACLNGPLPRPSEDCKFCAWQQVKA